MPTEIAGPREGLELIDLVGVGVYFLLTGAIVLWSSRKQANTDDFFLGGRRMPWMAVGLSILATLMSSISYMGVPGEMITNGVAMFAQYLALPFSMFVVLVVWVPFFMRLQVTSAYEYLEKRFDYRVRLMGGTLFLLLRLGWMSMVMYVGSLALTQMTASLIPPDRLDPLVGWFRSDPQAVPLLRETMLYWVIGAVGLAGTVYTCLGGFRAAIWNDVLQSLMLLGGTLITLGYVMWTTRTGPVDWWEIASQQTAGHTRPIWFSFDPTVRMTIVTAAMLSFFWTICTHGSDQVVLQRYFSTPSLSAARRSYMVNAASDLSIGVLLALSGLALLAFYLKHPTFLPEGILTLDAEGKTVVKHGDRVLPYFFAHQLPAGIGGVVVAVLVCDAMQSLVSGVNSISAVFTSDLFGRLHPQGEQKMSRLNLARLLTVAVGILVTGLGTAVAWLAQHSQRNIVDMMAPAFNMFLGPLAALFLIGMFLKCRARAAIQAVLCGVAISFVWSYWKDLFGTSYQPTITLTTAVPYLSSFLIAALLGRLAGDAQEHPGLSYTWFAVMRRQETPAEISENP
ncbi:MAG: sodium:solute symporter family transporter [Planctomycetales bacterium]